MSCVHCESHHPPLLVWSAVCVLFPCILSDVKVLGLREEGVGVVGVQAWGPASAAVATLFGRPTLSQNLNDCPSDPKSPSP